MSLHRLFPADDKPVPRMSRGGSGVDYTCPAIDSVIETVKEQIAAIREAQKLLDTQLDDATNTLLELVEGRNCPMEDLRTSNDTLRTYGEEQYQRAEDLDVELQDLYRRTE